MQFGVSLVLIHLNKEQRHVNVSQAYDRLELNAELNDISEESAECIKKILDERDKQEKEKEQANNQVDTDSEINSESDGDSDGCDDLEVLDDRELKQIEEINTNKEVKERLHELQIKYSKFKGAVSEFKKGLRKENKFLKKRKVEICDAKTFSEADDLSIEGLRTKLENKKTKRANGKSFTVVKTEVLRMKTNNKKRKRNIRESSVSSTSEAKKPRVGKAKPEEVKVRPEKAKVHPEKMKEAKKMNSGIYPDCFASEICTLGQFEDDNSRKHQINVVEPLAKILKDHQKKGVKYMWNKISLGTERKGDGAGQGCVLAHNMGLG